ncbi:MAG TPA: V-type ATP synthase subunit E family protein [Candidatus Thermoplasmatota archaeon]|nr:V-type ATP synthase subunit E family protein [Candidatus Thermoplasmatota archaeon]
MALEHVLESLRDQGRTEAAKEVTAARQEADALVAAARSEAAALVTRRKEEGLQAADLLRKREFAAAELESRKMRLEAERDVMIRLRAAVAERLAKVPSADREKHLAALAKTARLSGGRVFVREQDAAAAKAAGLAPAGTFQGLGGLLVQSADGSTTEDLRYENLLDDIWRDSLNDVAQIVFRKQGN